MSYSVFPPADAAGGSIIASMPPVACSGCGSDGSQMLFRSPTIPLEPAAHSPTRPPMSPMPGTWHTPPGLGAAGVRLAVSVSGEAAARAADAVRAVEAAAGCWVAWAALVVVVARVVVVAVVAVAASAGVEIASPATASSSTRISQREMRRPGEEESARSRPKIPKTPEIRQVRVRLAR